MIYRELYAVFYILRLLMAVTPPGYYLSISSYRIMPSCRTFDNGWRSLCGAAWLAGAGRLGRA